MKTISHRIPIIFFVMIFISVFITGCVQPINLGLMEIGKNSTVQEFYVDNYKMKVRVIPIADDYEYIYSLTLKNKNEGTPIKDVKSSLTVKKYSQYPRFHYRHQHPKQTIISGLEPFYDSTVIDYEYKYKFKNKGKYELTVKLTEIEGKELKKDVLVSFDQEVK